MALYSEHAALKIMFFVALTLVLFSPEARTLENCTCRLDDAGCRPIASMHANGVSWTYTRNRCHDRYVVRFGIIGRAQSQKDIKNAPHPCHVTDHLGNSNCSYVFSMNKDKPYMAVVEACTHSIVEGSSCTGFSAPAYWLPYGPDSCKEGFVWREAFANDHACVTAQRRTQAATENRAAAGNVQRGGGAYGPDTCKSGFVWREADRVGNTAGNDHVCVLPPRRGQVWAENAAARGNKAVP